MLPNWQVEWIPQNYNLMIPWTLKRGRFRLQGPWKCRENTWFDQSFHCYDAFGRFDKLLKSFCSVQATVISVNGTSAKYPFSWLVSGQWAVRKLNLLNFETLPRDPLQIWKSWGTGHYSTRAFDSNCSVYLPRSLPTNSNCQQNESLSEDLSWR